MSFEQRRLEDELLKLTIHLTPSPEDLEEGKRNATRLFELLKQESKFRIDRVGVFGSIEKKTSIKVDFDFDCVVFVNDVLPPYECVIKDFEDVLTLAENWSLKMDISRSPNSIRVMINNVKFDVVVAINFNQNIKIQRDQVMRKIACLEHPAKDGYKFSSSLDETQAEFVKNQSEFAHNFIRLAKYWNRTLYVKGYFSGRSSMIEIAALYVAKEEERKYSTTNILRAFREFLLLIKNLNGVKIIFEEYYKSKDISDYIVNQRPLVLDPSNPFNNLAYPFIKNKKMKDSFQEFAATTICRLEQALFTFCFNAIFNLQPTMAPIEDVIESVPPFENWIFTIRDERSDKRPNVIVRNEKKVVRLGMEIIKHYLTKNINVFNSNSSNKVEMESEIVKIVSSNILNESTTRSLQPTNKQHEDYDVTFEIPGKNFMTIVSTKWN